MPDNPLNPARSNRGITFHPHLIAGIFFAVTGLSAAVYAALFYRLGSLSSMGPGFTPMLVGTCLSLSGAWLVWDEAKRQRLDVTGEETASIESSELRAVISTIGAVLVFALTLPVLGLFLALSAMIACSKLAKPFLWRQLLVQIIVLNFLAYILFVLALNIPFKLLPF